MIPLIDEVNPLPSPRRHVLPGKQPAYLHLIAHRMPAHQARFLGTFDDFRFYFAYNAVEVVET